MWLYFLERNKHKQARKKIHIFFSYLRTSPLRTDVLSNHSNFPSLQPENGSGKNHQHMINYGEKSLSLLLFSRSVMSYSFATLWTVALQGPLSLRFHRQEYWSGLPCPSPRESSQPSDWTHVSCIGRLVLYHWATKSLMRSKTRP